jgi:UDP-N-acetylmuramyl-tripeptide synthetase
MKNLTLIQLAQAINFQLSSNNFNSLVVSNITANSANVVKGSIFVAIKGIKFNGEDYIIQAIKKGASLCIIDDESNYEPINEVLGKVIKVKSLQPKLSNDKNTKNFLAKALFHINEQNLPENILTITGTNGKTSTAFFVSQFLNLLNKSNVLIGTTGVFLNNNNISTKIAESITTPGVEDLCKYFINAKQNGANYVIMESSSHGISQNRILGINFSVAGFTNLTQDHLDYHSSMEDYFYAKAKLFKDFNINNVVINIDDIYGERLTKLTTAKNILDYGKNAKTCKIKSITLNNNTQNINGIFKGKEFNFSINMLGRFQVYNILCAMLMLVSVGEDFFKLIELASKITPAEGRLNLIKATINKNISAKIFIDYAHTPDALENVLKTLKSLDNKAIVRVVFGCGGERDKAKRPIMGSIAIKYADAVYLTDDNPRGEDATLIREDVLKGMDASMGKAIYNIGDRKIAIQKAIDDLKDNDLLIVAGKGHEEYQIIGNQHFAFSDKQEVLNYIASIGGKYEF